MTSHQSGRVPDFALAVSSLRPADNWPRLADLGLSADSLNWRRLGVGGSDANIILGGDADKCLQLWREKCGEAESEDLSSILPVMLGNWSEAFNRQWYEAQTGLSVTESDSQVTCDIHSWRRATLDGLVPERQSVWEAKRVNAFAKPDAVIEKYMPQLQHNMAVVGLDHATLSVIYGNHKWECYEIAADWLYQEELLQAEERFWDCVKTGEVPVGSKPLAAPRPDKLREVSFAGNNAWAAAAADWLANVGPAKRHADATKSIKAMIEDDVGRACGYGIEARRSRSGAVTIKEAIS